MANGKLSGYVAATLGFLTFACAERKLDFETEHSDAGAAGAGTVDASTSGGSGAAMTVARGGTPAIGRGGASTRTDSSTPPASCNGIAAESPMTRDCASWTVSLDVSPSAASACRFVVPQIPDAPSLDPNLWDLILVSNSGENTRLPRLATVDDCAKSAYGGYYFEDNLDPKTIALCPCSCTAVQRDSLVVTGVYGCDPWLTAPMCLGLPVTTAELDAVRSNTCNGFGFEFDPTLKQDACAYQMVTSPTAPSLDSNRAEVLWQSSNGESTRVPRVEDAFGCMQSLSGGYFFDNPADPLWINLCPCTCEAAHQASGSLDVLFNCAGGPTLVQ